MTIKTFFFFTTFFYLIFFLSFLKFSMKMTYNDSLHIHISAFIFEKPYWIFLLSIHRNGFWSFHTFHGILRQKQMKRNFNFDTKFKETNEFAALNEIWIFSSFQLNFYVQVSTHWMIHGSFLFLYVIHHGHEVLSNLALKDQLVPFYST